MGFCAKMVILTKGTAEADRLGPNGEAECEVWSDADLTIDFGHVTRLEKITGERFKHLTHTSSRRAGICVVDCLLGHLFSNFDEDPAERLAPEIILHKGFLGEEGEPDIVPTETVGGEIYVDCSAYRLKGMIRDTDELIIQHNTTIKLGPEAFKVYLQKHHIYLDGPFLWASCADLAKWMLEADRRSSEGWQALAEDRVSLAIAKGWYHQLQELSEVGAQAVFRFS